MLQGQFDVTRKTRCSRGLTRRPGKRHSIRLRARATRGFGVRALFRASASAKSPGASQAPTPTPRCARGFFSHPLLLADVGGTNVRITLAPEPGAPLQSIGHFATADFPRPRRGAVQQAISRATACKPRSMIACAAGPREVPLPFSLTNANWHIDGPEVAQALALEQGLLLNDFEAQALSLPVLRPRRG